MQIPLQITVRDMPRSDALDARIRDKVAGLERFNPRITSCRVIVAESRKHHQQGRRFEVDVYLRMPGHAEIIANHHAEEDVYIALREAFASATRQIEDTTREQRGDVKLHEQVLHGTVARLYADQGFGFIAAGDGREYYFSRENVVHPPFEHLEPGAAVQFLEAAGSDGGQAHRVSARKHPLPPE